MVKSGTRFSVSSVLLVYRVNGCSIGCVEVHVKVVKMINSLKAHCPHPHCSRGANCEYQHLTILIECPMEHVFEVPNQNFTEKTSTKYHGKF